MKPAAISGITLATLAVLGGGYALIRAASAGPPDRRPGAGAPRTVELTVYNQDFALVRETRDVNLEKGANRLAFPDVSRSLDPHSVLLRWETDGPAAPPDIIGQSYDLGVRDIQALLQHAVGQDVELVRYGQDGREAARERGRLLAAEGGVRRWWRLAGRWL